MLFISFTQRDAQNRNMCVLNYAGLALKKQRHCRNSVWQMQMEKQSAWLNRRCLQPSRLSEGGGEGFSERQISPFLRLHVKAVFLILKVGLWLPWCKEYPACSFPWWLRHASVLSQCSIPVRCCVFFSYSHKFWECISSEFLLRCFSLTSLSLL